MYTKTFSFISTLIVVLLLSSSYAHADRPLKKTLDLNTEQSAKVAAIQKEARDAMRKPRGNLHQKQRALRRAKKANDSLAIAELEQEILPLQNKMRQIFANEEGKIRAVLTPAQAKVYEAWLMERDTMVGSSRDVKDPRN